jgi:hypothetical protein
VTSRSKERHKRSALRTSDQSVMSLAWERGRGDLSSAAGSGPLFWSGVLLLVTPKRGPRSVGPPSFALPNNQAQQYRRRSGPGPHCVPDQVGGVEGGWIGAETSGQCKVRIRRRLLREWYRTPALKEARSVNNHGANGRSGLSAMAHRLASAKLAHVIRSALPEH